MEGTGHLFHEVKSGDTMQGIAIQHETSVSALKRMNRLYGDSSLFVGQRLRVREDLPSSDSIDNEESGEEEKKHKKSKSKKKKLAKKVINMFRHSKKAHKKKGRDTDQKEESASCSTNSSPEKLSPSEVVYGFLTNSLLSSARDSSRQHNKESGDDDHSKDRVDTKDLDTGEVIVNIPTSSRGGSDDVHSSAEDTDIPVLNSSEHRVLDIEFDAELVETNENYFAPNKSQAVSTGQGRDKSRPRVQSFSRVEILGNSHILSDSLARALVRHLPIMLQASKWSLLYSVLNNGADMYSFFKLTKGSNKTILIIETFDGEVFGGFATEEWHIDLSYYGGGESFVFKCDQDGNNLKVFKWSNDNHFVMWSNEIQIAMGGGGDGFAFALDSDFHTGQSSKSATFDNDPLVSTLDSFQVKDVEVWKIDSCI